MTSDRITVRIPQDLGRRLRSRSRTRGQSESDVVREALETYLDHAKEKRSAYAIARDAGLIGTIAGAPKDLSTNPRHFEGFGKRK